MRTARFFAAATTLLLVACGDSTGPEPTGPTGPTYESIAATYAGALVGNAQGIALTATFSITITQTGGDLSGSWSLVGTLNDGVVSVDVQGTGTLSGSIASGQNPSVNLTIRNACANYEARFSGAYDSANRRLTIGGPVDILDGCTVVITYQSTIILDR